LHEVPQTQRRYNFKHSKNGAAGNKKSRVTDWQPGCPDKEDPWLSGPRLPGVWLYLEAVM